MQLEFFAKSKGKNPCNMLLFIHMLRYWAGTPFQSVSTATQKCAAWVLREVEGRKNPCSLTFFFFYLFACFVIRWERRFFTLADDTLTTFKSDRTSEVESVMSLKRCVLRDEGTRAGKAPGRGKVRWHDMA